METTSSALDRIEALAKNGYLTIIDRTTGIKMFPDALIAQLVAVVRTAERAAEWEYFSAEYESPEEFRARSDIYRALTDATAALDRYVDEHLPKENS